MNSPATSSLTRYSPGSSSVRWHQNTPSITYRRSSKRKFAVASTTAGRSSSTSSNSIGTGSIPYTIVAGDIRDYEASVDPLAAKLIANLGHEILFHTLYQNADQDIAVSDDSIGGVAADRSSAHNKSTVICHNLNYFGSDAGLRAMADVLWIVIFSIQHSATQNTPRPIFASSWVWQNFLARLSCLCGVLCSRFDIGPVFFPLIAVTEVTHRRDFLGVLDIPALSVAFESRSACSTSCLCRA